MPFSSRQLSIFVLLALLTGCSLKPKPSAPEAVMAPAQRQQQLSAMQQFTVQASMGLKSPAESVTGNLRWQQFNEADYQARLANMLGISLFELRQQTDLTELQVRGERYQAADASSLLWQLVGWSIPLHDMALWLRGLPGDSATELQYDNAGRLVSFVLTDSTGIRWQLSYRSFFDDALSLPRQLQLQSDDTQIRLIIRSWQP
ncbi:lipoprotein insertase outer membrane protein LolB [Alishewanella longhuensis]|nr:lipoprotein insertase outer membrane protein LolB [Alishewanella longhuensis]